MNITKIETNYKEKKFFHTTPNIVATKQLGELETELIMIYPNIEYQEILGFGGAFTEAGGYALANTNTEIYKQVMNEYFSENGLSYNLCRTHINSCDFSLGNYAYLENQDLDKFNIDRDKKFLIPMIKSALNINTNIKLLASPWSPPAFMKSNNKMNQGGKLLNEYKQLWADYLAKYIKAYSKEGINIKYMTIQNEPKAVQIWESCEYLAEEEGNLITKYIFPTFKKNNINVKLLIWDHNKERLYLRAKATIKDEEILNQVDGIAYHYYSGNHFENIEIIRKMYPNKLIIHTEGCTGYSKFKRKDEITNAEIYGLDILGDLNAGSNGYIDWNMVLDYKGGPNHKDNFCNAPIMINKKNNSYIKNLTYYYIGHFSKYIKTAAKRIAFSRYTDKIEATVFKNFDNTIVVVLLNKTDDNINFNLCVKDIVYRDNIKAHSIITLCM